MVSIDKIKIDWNEVARCFVVSCKKCNCTLEDDWGYCPDCGYTLK